ncbi:Tn3 family transposase [Nonomuraea fuscirosea]|uniref:Tn3 family transposase n=1 Tax=Nonomuraea fuscirosea TaxID=1291556 RepID=UPI0034313708
MSMERPPLSMDELVDQWTVLSDEAGLVNVKQESTRLAFALLLKFYTQHGRFPRGRAEFPDEVVDYVARQTRTPASTLGLYEWSGRTIERHRREIRDHLGFRECSVLDADKLTEWPAVNVAHAERQSERVREELLKRCWHVERGSVVVHSQTLKASASEVAAMVEGAIRHGTTMKVEGNYVDSHGESEPGFAVTRLLNVDLLPRIKQINRVNLYQADHGDLAGIPTWRRR